MILARQLTRDHKPKPVGQSKCCKLASLIGWMSIAKVSEGRNSGESDEIILTWHAWFNSFISSDVHSHGFSQKYRCRNMVPLDLSLSSWTCMAFRLLDPHFTRDMGLPFGSLTNSCWAYSCRSVWEYHRPTMMSESSSEYQELSAYGVMVSYSQIMF